MAKGKRRGFRALPKRAQRAAFARMQASGKLLPLSKNGKKRNKMYIAYRGSLTSREDSIASAKAGKFRNKWAEKAGKLSKKGFGQRKKADSYLSIKSANAYTGRHNAALIALRTGKR